jgi:molybdopterin synthase sulfur carrier subunit
VPRVSFTANLQRHVPCPPCDVEGATVKQALENAFTLHPRVRDYVLDEHGAVRHHVVVFVDGRQVRDRRTLTDAVSEGGQIHVMQALSGG